MDSDPMTRAILGAAIEVHRKYGPGLLESVYEALLARGLESRGFKVLRQQSVQLHDGDIRFDEAFRADIIVDGRVIIEVKSVARLEPIFARQLLTYLRLTGLPLGLVINFGAVTLMEGVKRVINTGPAAPEPGPNTPQDAVALLRCSAPSA
jgi:iron complex transport system substrate-binding protein